MKKIILFLLIILLMLNFTGCSDPQNNNEDHYLLTISSEGEGTTEPPAGEHQYDKDSMVNLTVTPDTENGWYFDKWEGPDRSERFL